jgi:hypothetical protein
MDLWNTSTEIQFFNDALNTFASPEQLFYRLGSDYYAYFPKGFNAKGATLQSRNSLIGRFTENWSKRIFDGIAQSMGLYAVDGVICEEIGLTNKSSADLAFCTTDEIRQKPENIKLVFEIKMSIVSNYKFVKPDQIEWIGDYKSHKGNPSLLRSDSMLKAIGKSVNIRIASLNSASIPVVVLGNSPITQHYEHKVDFLRSSGMIQGFWSLNPSPTGTTYIIKSEKSGFITFTNYDEIASKCSELISSDNNFFSAMIPKSQLGQFIRISAEEVTDLAKGEKFLELLKLI